jgi:hypothetical protein
MAASKRTARGLKKEIAADEGVSVEVNRAPIVTRSALSKLPTLHNNNPIQSRQSLPYCATKGMV